MIATPQARRAQQPAPDGAENVMGSSARRRERASSRLALRAPAHPLSHPQPTQKNGNHPSRAHPFADSTTRNSGLLSMECMAASRGIALARARCPQQLHLARAGGARALRRLGRRCERRDRVVVGASASYDGGESGGRAQLDVASALKVREPTLPEMDPRTPPARMSTLMYRQPSRISALDLVWSLNYLTRHPAATRRFSASRRALSSVRAADGPSSGFHAPGNTINSPKLFPELPLNLGCNVPADEIVAAKNKILSQNPDLELQSLVRLAIPLALPKDGSWAGAWPAVGHSICSSVRPGVAWVVSPVAWPSAVAGETVASAGPADPRPQTPLVRLQSVADACRLTAVEVPRWIAAAEFG